MKRYNVQVAAHVIDTVPVDANDGTHAMELAQTIVLDRLGAYRPCGEPSIYAEAEAAEEAPDARTVTQVCNHCGTSAGKEMWGPGQMKCPHCGRRPTSVGEVFGMLRLLADAVDPANPGPTLAAIATAEAAGYTEAGKAARAMLAEKGIS